MRNPQPLGAIIYVDVVLLQEVRLLVPIPSAIIIVLFGPSLPAPVKVPSLPLGPPVVILGVDIQSRIILPFVIPLAPPILIDMAQILPLVPIVVPLQVKAAQERLQLKGQEIRPLKALKQWQFMQTLLLQPAQLMPPMLPPPLFPPTRLASICTLTGKPLEEVVLLNPIGKATASPFEGEVPLSSMLVISPFFLRFVRYV